jgi:hypothetical protein
MAVAHVIQGQEVTLPCIVREASSGAVTYLVDARAARAMLPDDTYEVVELLPGRGLLSLAIIDYKDNDLGDYNEVSIAFMVRPPGKGGGIPYLGGWLDLLRGNLSTYIHWLPVNQTFTREAGAEIWGFPKTVEEIGFEYAEDRATCRLTADGRHVLTLSVPRGGTRTLPDSAMNTYTYIHGVPHRVPFHSGAAGFGFKLGGAELKLGDHPYAEQLRGLGLPRRPLMCTWMEKMHGRFEAPEKL